MDSFSFLNKNYCSSINVFIKVKVETSLIETGFSNMASDVGTSFIKSGIYLILIRGLISIDQRLKFGFNDQIGVSIG